MPLDGFSPISIYATCFVLVCVAVALYRVIGRRTERATAVARGPLGVGLGLAGRPVRVCESTGAAVSSRAAVAPRFDGVAVGASRDAGLLRVQGNVRVAAKSYYASSEGQVQIAMLPPLGIPSETHDLSAVVPASEWDSTNLGWNGLGLLVTEPREEIVRVDRRVDAEAEVHAVVDANEGAQTSIAAVAEDVAIDANAPVSEETIEIVEIAPAAAEETKADVSAEAAPVEIAEIEAAPAEVETADALIACALPIQEAAESVDAAIVPFVANAALDSSVADEQVAIEPAEIAAPPVAEATSDMHAMAEPAASESFEIAGPLVADESGDRFDAAELAAIAEMEDCSDLPSIAAVVGPTSPLLGF